MCFLLARSFPKISVRNFIVAVKELPYSKPDVGVAFKPTLQALQFVQALQFGNLIEKKKE